jgi:hypothetical protein
MPERHFAMGVMAKNVCWSYIGELKAAFETARREANFHALIFKGGLGMIL